MYVCNDCGRTFEELKTWEEDRGEFWGQPCYENMSGCPYCFSGDFDEVNDDESADDDENEEIED